MSDAKCGVVAVASIPRRRFRPQKIHGISTEFPAKCCANAHAVCGPRCRRSPIRARRNKSPNAPAPPRKGRGFSRLKRGAARRGRGGDGSGGVGRECARRSDHSRRAPAVPPRPTPRDQPPHRHTAGGTRRGAQETDGDGGGREASRRPYPARAARGEAGAHGDGDFRRAWAGGNRLNERREKHQGRNAPSNGRGTTSEIPWNFCSISA